MAPTDDDYRTAASANGFGNRIGWGKRPAILLIDVCTAYWTPGSSLDTSSNPASAASLDVMRHLLAAAREANSAPVIWTTVKYKSDMSDAGLFYSKAKQLSIWAEGDDRRLGQWVEGLVPRKGEEVVEKR
jgi:nicotinamidase-related amidase